MLSIAMLVRELRITYSGSFILMFQYQSFARLEQYYVEVTLPELEKYILLLMMGSVNYIPSHLKVVKQFDCNTC